MPLAASFAADVGSVWLASCPHLAFFLAAAVLAHARLADAAARPPTA